MPSLVIKPETLRMFTEAQTVRANNGLIHYLRQRFPDLLRARPDSEMLALVEEARRRAKRFGIEREDNVATFLDLTVMFPGFPDLPWAQDIVESEKLHGPDKMALLRNRVERHGTEL